MDWLAANWLWIVVGVAFVAFHMFGHGGHGGHGGHKSSQPEGDDIKPGPPSNDQSGGRHH